MSRSRHESSFSRVAVGLCLTLGILGCPRDIARPTATISSTSPNPTDVSPIPVAVTFSEVVEGFEPSDIIVSNAAVQDFTGSGADYALVLIPLAAGPVTLDIPASVAHDAAGNGNTAAVQFSRVYDPSLAWHGFADPNLEAAVRAWFQAAGTPLGETIQAADLVNAGFTELDASERTIADLSGLEAATDLATLNLFKNNVSDLEPIASLTNLRVLNLGRNQVSDLGPLSGLTDLVSLELGIGNPNTDAGFDATVTEANRVSDISPLASLTNLTYLSLVGNAGLTDITPLGGLTRLQQLWLGYSVLSDFSPLAFLAELRDLIVAGSGFDDSDVCFIEHLGALSALRVLYEPGLTNISKLGNLDLACAYFQETGISDISVAANWPHLREIAVILSPVSDISALAGLPDLDEAVFEGCLITDISVLAGLPRLRNAGLADNQIEDIAPLLRNPGFRDRAWLDISGNPLSESAVCEDLPALQSRLDNAENLVSNQVCRPVTLTIAVSGPGSTTPEPGAHSVALGETVRIVAYPAAGTGFAFSEWRGDASGTATAVDVAMDSDKTVEAVFVEGGGWTLTVSSAGEGGSAVFPGPGVYSYLDGQAAYFTVGTVQEYDAATGYFAGWSGALTGSRPDESLVMDGNHTVVALFEDAGFELELGVEGIGTTRPLPGRYRFASTVKVPLEAVETDPVRRFSQWEGDTESTDPSVTVIMDRDRKVTAVFPWNQDLTISVEGGGMTDPSPGILDVPWSETVAVRAYAQEGWYLDHWEGSVGERELRGRATGDPAPPVVNILMDQPYAMTAVFMEGDWDLAVDIEGGGTTSLSTGTQTFPDGHVVVVEPLYSRDWYFDRWEGDIGTANPYCRVLSLPMDAHRIVTAVFLPTVHTLTVNVAGNGNTYPEPGAYGFGEGQIARVFAFPDAGSMFTGWQDGSANSRPVTEIVMEGDNAVTAVFSEVADRPLTFGDPNVEAVVRQGIGKPEGEILPQDVVELYALEPTYRRVASLAGIEVLTSLARFNCYGNGLADITPVGALTNLLCTDMASNQIVDVSAVSGLPFLEDLNFGANWVQDVSGLANLPNLTTFVAFENDLSDVAALADFSRLRYIDLSGNQVTDIAALAGLTGLQFLYLDNNMVADIGPATGLKALKRLDLAGNPVTDVSPVSSLSHLLSLDLSGCEVDDVAPLEHLPRLTFVSLNSSPVSDLTPLVDNPDFAEGDELYALDCPLSQDAVCNQIPLLESRGVGVHTNATCTKAPLQNEAGPCMMTSSDGTNRAHKH